MMYGILHIFFLIIFICLAISVTYLLVISIAGALAKRRNFSSSVDKKRIAVLITSYKEDEVIVNTVRSAVNHDYPAGNFDVFVAADQLQPSTIATLKTLGADIKEVQFKTGSKARSLNFLLNKIDGSKYDVALVLDADNIMMPGFLERINAIFQQGHQSVQAHRTAKNLNTPIAILDGISEEINNHLFRKAQRALGFSSSLIGSGMAFEFTTLKKIYDKPGILDNPACDREVDFEMTKAGITIEYDHNALLLDEKVATNKVFENQRRRWLESQLSHLSLFFSKNEKIDHKTKDFWNKLFINLLPPRIIFVGIFMLIFLVCLIEYITHVNLTGIAIRWWLLLFSAYVVAMLIAIPSRFRKWSTINAILHLPIILLSYIKAALSLKSGRKEFIHTPKSFTGQTKTTEKKEY